MKKSFTILITVVLLLTLTSCDLEESAQAPTTTYVPPYEAPSDDESTEGIGESPDISTEDLIEHEEIRVFEKGAVSVKLFPDETFTATLYHNLRITGTYTEMVHDDESAILFTHNGRFTVSGGVPELEIDDEAVTVVGGIKDNIFTMPEEWDCHNHGRELEYRAYPLEFINSDDNKCIILYADNTFHADFGDGIVIVGYYAVRSSSVAFAIGSPSFSSDGEPTGIFLLSTLDEDEDGNTTLEIPELWLEATKGETVFTLE